MMKLKQEKLFEIEKDNFLREVRLEEEENASQIFCPDLFSPFAKQHPHLFSLKSLTFSLAFFYSHYWISLSLSLFLFLTHTLTHSLPSFLKHSNFSFLVFTLNYESSSLSSTQAPGTHFRLTQPSLSVPSGSGSGWLSCRVTHSRHRRPWPLQPWPLPPTWPFSCGPKNWKALSFGEER